MSGERYSDPRAAGPKAPTEPEIATIERFRDRIRVFTAHRTGDWTAAEDIAQETIRRALEALEKGRIRETAALPGFLFQTAVHICLDRNRSAGREKRALRRYADSPLPDPDDPLFRLISEERRRRVREALHQLAQDEEKILSLTYVEHVDTGQIARRLGMTEGNVRVRRHRALKKLAAILGVTKDTDQGLKE
jgi:RNA polymerase sigma-70 factor (ECF subfamily)